MPLLSDSYVLPLGEVVTRWARFAAVLLYCSASFLCAYALWRVRPYALHAYYAFIASLGLCFMVWLFLVHAGAWQWSDVLFFGLQGFGAYFGWRVIQRASGPAASAL